MSCVSSLVLFIFFLDRPVFQVLVHGEQTAMGRLRAAMSSRYKDRDEDVKIHTPRNLETLNLSFRGERVAKVRRQLHSVCLVIMANITITGHRYSSIKTSSGQRYYIRPSRGQGLLVHSSGPTRPTGLCRVVNVYCHTETKDSSRCWLGTCSVASGGNVWKCGGGIG